jgi:hypothetical protein
MRMSSPSTPASVRFGMNGGQLATARVIRSFQYQGFAIPVARKRAPGRTQRNAPRSQIMLLGFYEDRPSRSIRCPRGSRRQGRVRSVCAQTTAVSAGPRKKGRQVHSKGGVVKTASKIRRPFEFCLCTVLPIVFRIPDVADRSIFPGKQVSNRAGADRAAPAHSPSIRLCCGPVGRRGSAATPSL